MQTNTTIPMTKFRLMPEYNYFAIYNNLCTIRFRVGEIKELPPEQSEFYDVSLGTKCRTGKCPFCYAGASPYGEYYTKVCDTWKKWMDITENKPFQIAIGSGGEPTEHPEFIKFLETVASTGVTPNYTTNGMLIAQDNDRSNAILEATGKYAGGVAVSVSNRYHYWNALKALYKLKGYCKVAVHFIISDTQSVTDWCKIVYRIPDVDKYVLLPLVSNGETAMTQEAWEYLERILIANPRTNISLGAKFLPFLENSELKRSLWYYPPETYSKNALLANGKVILTRSSFDLSILKEICFD